MTPATAQPIDYPQRSRLDGRGFVRPREVPDR